jgi:hypothetical protein
MRIKVMSALRYILKLTFSSIAIISASCGWAQTQDVPFAWTKPVVHSQKDVIKLIYNASGFYADTDVILCQNHPEAPVMMCCLAKGQMQPEFIYSGDNNSCHGGHSAMGCQPAGIVAGGQYTGAIGAVDFAKVQNYCKKPQ